MSGPRGAGRRSRGVRRPGGARRTGRAAAAALAAGCLLAACTGGDADPTGSATPGTPTSTTAGADISGSEHPTASGSTSGAPSTGSTATGSTTSSDDPTAQCVADLISGMTPRQRAGQLLMVGLSSEAGQGGVDEVVTTYGLGGVIYLGHWSGHDTVAATSAHLQGLTKGPDLLIAADQEGGQVQQLTGSGFTTIPDAATQAGLSPNALRDKAHGWGQELASAGVNLNLAPVADTVPASIGTANGPIGQFHREYGATPDTVIPPMTAFLAGMHDAGVMATVKHFPGIGRITGNTDTTAFGIEDSAATTDDPHLQPFRAGIEAGADLVMVSSARYPKLAKEQAAFAPEIVTGLLREQLGFTGVVITDDVGAAAAVQSIPVGERATRFLAAGGDMVLTALASDIPVMVKALTKAAETDEAAASRMHIALRRVLTLKTAHGLTGCAE